MSGLPWWTFALLLVGFSAGVMALVLLSPVMPLVAAVVLVGVLIAVVRPRLWPIVLLTLLAMALGVARAAVAPTVALPAGLGTDDVSVSGTVDDDPQTRRSGTRLTIRIDHIQVPGLGQVSTLRVQATVYGGVPVHYGDLVLLRGRLQPPPAFDQFDYRAYLAEQGIAGVMPSARLIRDTPHPGDPLHTALFAVRHGLVRSVDRALPEPQAALVLGVVFGYRATLPITLEQAMIASGLIHIVVISGLKVSLLARIMHGALGRVLPRAAPGLALAAMLGYALLAGASAAALRAAAMGALVVIAGRLRRDSHVYVSLALTAAIMLGVKPALARDVSFLLSFAGTAGIAGFTDGIAARLSWMPAVLRDPFAATLAAEAATWPLMLANFHQLSVVAPLANALVLPLLPLLMVVGGGGAIVGALFAAGAWPALQLAGALAAWYRDVIEVCGALPAAAIVMPYFPGRWLAAAVILNGGALAAVKLRAFFWHRRVWAILGAASLLAVALLLIRPDGRVHLYALDVGTGSAVLVRTGEGKQVLIDGGPDPDKFAQAIGRALPPTARELKAWIITGGRRLQLGAASAVLERFQVDLVIVADPDPWTPTLRAVIQQAGADGVPVRIGAQPVQVDGVELRPMADARTWVIRSGAATAAVIPPDSSGHALSGGLSAAVFTGGGPPDWDGVAAACLAVIQVSAHRVDGLPTRALLGSLRPCQVLRPDATGTVELIAGQAAFRPVSSG
ncbi:MAG TPA: ComEC/Rec2 family competence protein [Candidatus Dormibacteraeota bacterium]